MVGVCPLAGKLNVRQPLNPFLWSNMKPLTTILINVKGSDWTFKLFTDRAFNKLHNPTGEENNAAMTLLNIREVHFSKSDWCLVDLRHELVHVFYAMTHTSSSDHDPLQVEETIAEIIGQNYSEIGVISDKVAERFFNYNKD